MIALVLGCCWLLVVCWLLIRVLNRGRAFRAASLGPAHPGDAAPGAFPAATAGGSVAVIIPARNEANNIACCLAGIREQRPASGLSTIVVVDDASGDATADLVRAAAARDPRIRLISTGGPPRGWLGKPRACWVGALAAEADWLCFLDADVRTQPPLLAAAVSAAERNNIDLLSLQPLQELGSFWERLVIPAGMLLAAAAGRAQNEHDASAITVNGQFLLVRSDRYRRMGGHAAVRGEVCEDNALARLMHRTGGRVRVLGAEHLARTRMYTGLSELWEGFGKNATEIIGGAARTVAVGIAGALFACVAWLLPICLVVLASRHPDTAHLAGLLAAVAGSGIVLGIQGGTLRHFRTGIVLLPLLPLGFAVAAALACASARSHRLGRVRWKGRTYRLSEAPPSPAAVPPDQISTGAVPSRPSIARHR